MCVFVYGVCGHVCVCVCGHVCVSCVAEIDLPPCDSSTSDYTTDDDDGCDGDGGAVHVEGGGDSDPS